MKKLIRLDKFLSNANFGTRSHVKTLIKHGAIKIDNEIIVNPAYLFDPLVNRVYLNDKLIAYEEEVVFILNKPKDYICSNIAELYPSVLDLLPKEYERKLKIVGRLDVDTTGVLLLTTKGKLVNYLTHPKNNIEKTYTVKTNHEIPKEMVERVKEPIDIGRGEYSLPCKLEIIDDFTANITLTEGKYHEVKRIFHYFNLEVISLDRINFHGYTYGNLKQGEYYKLNDDELNEILKLVNGGSENV